MNIPIYAPAADDFTGNGLGMLTPLECVIEETAAGMYELTLVHPIDDSLRWAMIAPGCILKAPAPVRETPLYEAPASGEPVTVTRQVWVVSGTTHGLYIRTGPGMHYPRMGVKKNGVEVLELEDAPDPWKKVCVLNSGQVGYMSTKYLSPLRTVTEVISPGAPTGGVLKIGQSRDQLFRIYAVEQDSAAAAVTARAMHIFYDEAGNLSGSCDFSAPTEVNTALAAIEESLALEPRIHIRPLNLTGQITGDFSGKSPVEALLNPDTGIIRQTRALLVRDNWDAYLLPDMVRDRGVTIRRGKNLIGAQVTSDASAVATRVIPVGRNRNGDPLYLPGPGWVDSPRAGEHPFPRIRRIEYDVQTGENGLGSDEAAQAELRRLAEAEFSENGIDLPVYGMDVDFILLGNTEEYAQYAALQAVHLYDTVTVIDEMLGLRAKVRVTGYKWNCLTGQYEGVTLGQMQDIQQTVYSFNLPDGGVSGTKIMANTLGGSALRNATIDYAKIAVAAVRQLTADSLAALTARIQELVAGSVTADELYAGIADITKATIETADIDWASINELNAAIATLVQAKIGTADIDWAHIKDMVTDTAIITEGVGGQLLISRLAVTEANMVSLTTGELVVKGEDGHFYSLSVDENGGIITTLKQISNDDVQNLSLNAGEKLIEGSVTAACLNAREIFADNALIRQLIAANLDVDALFAREAFVNLLRTGKIVGDKSIEMIAGETDALRRRSGIEVIEGTFAQAERRPGEGIRVFSEFGPKQDLKWGAPYMPGNGRNKLVPNVHYGIKNGIEFTLNADGSWTVKGTATAGNAFFNLNYVNSTTSSFPPGEYIVTGGSADVRVQVMINGDVYRESAGGNPRFTISETTPNCWVRLQVPNAGMTVEKTVYPMVRPATDADESYAPPGNICPITGRNALNMTAAGKNLLHNTAASKTVNGVTFTVNADGSVHVKGTTTADNTFLNLNYTDASASFLSPGDYILSGAPGTALLLLIVDSKWNAYASKGAEKTFTIGEGITNSWVRIQIDYAGTTLDETLYPMVRRASVKDAGYKPYTRADYLLRFGETFYGGSVDWHAGEMTVTWAAITLDGSETVKKSGSTIMFTPDRAPVRGYGNSISSHYDGADIYCGADINIHNALAGTGYEDWNAFTSAQYAAGTPVQFAWKLAEPYTIQLTPAQLASLEGVNTVYTDADGGRVEFGHELSEVTDSAMEPLSPKPGALWLDLGLTPAVLRRFNGSQWETVNDVTLIETVQDALLTKQAQLEAAQRETALFLKLDAANKVVRIGQSGVTSEYRIDAFGSGVVVNNEIFSRFEANRAVFGNMEMRRPGVGGLAFDSIV